MKSLAKTLIPPSSLYSTDGEGHVSLEHFRLFGVRIYNTGMEQAVAYATNRAKTGEPANLAFVNADCLNKAWSDGEYRQVLNRFDRVYADGSGIRLACRLKGWPVPDNVNGTDLFPRLCLAAAAQGLSLFLLGGHPGIAASCAQAMQARYAGLRIAGTQHGYFAPAAAAEVLKRINASGADVLLVGFGAPAQELWIAGHAQQLAPAVRIGVGGLFDFYSGRIPRAPLRLRQLGLEWTWRLAQEPIRLWRRYLIGNPLFLLRVLASGR